jgi:hypothetical protein
MFMADSTTKSLARNGTELHTLPGQIFLNYTNNMWLVCGIWLTYTSIAQTVGPLPNNKLAVWQLTDHVIDNGIAIIYCNKC